MTSFWRYNDAITPSCVQWEVGAGLSDVTMLLGSYWHLFWGWYVNKFKVLRLTTEYFGKYVPLSRCHTGLERDEVDLSHHNINPMFEATCICLLHRASGPRSGHIAAMGCRCMWIGQEIRHWIYTVAAGGRMSRNPITHQTEFFHFT